MITKEVYDNDFESKWCPGCGNFGILAALKSALAAQNISPDQIVFISGIGQAAKTPHFLNGNFFHTLHGRALAVATGAKIANHELNIVVNSGDGDCYGEGGNHFMNAIRRNLDITLLVHDNGVYGLTKGQASPTSDLGFVTKMQNQGTIAEPFNPLTVALSLGIGFIARAFSNDRTHLSTVIQEAMQFKGFSMVDILQPCVIYNKVNTHSWYKKRVYKLDETDHDLTDYDKAYSLVRKRDDKIPIGVIYKREKETFTERIPKLQTETLLKQSYNADKIQEMLSAL